MTYYQYISLICATICFTACLWHIFLLLKKGIPKDLSQKSGNIAKAELYSYTIAMLPGQKESAYMHKPTFTLGIIFHIGTFAALLLFGTLFFVQLKLFPFWIKQAICIVLILGAISGFTLFIKRIALKKLRNLSNLDDFVSNLLTTLFQFFSVQYLICEQQSTTCYYIVVSLLLLYIPIGKLRHVIYFFAARYHLGFFYGWRNTWPPFKNK